MATTREEAQRRRSEARARRRSSASEPTVNEEPTADEPGPSDRINESPPKSSQPSEQSNTLKHAAVTAVAGAIAAGLGGAAKALLERREADTSGGEEGDGRESEPLETGDRDDTLASSDEEQPNASGESNPGEDAPDDETAEEEPDWGSPPVHPAPRAEETDAEPESEPEPRAEQPESEPDEDEDSQPRGAPTGNAGEIVDEARTQLERLLGTESEGVTGFERSDGRWSVTLEVVEVHRVPDSTDVLASYEVILDDDRNLVSLDRKRRYRRAQVEEE
jgi:hypothetical protein